MITRDINNVNRYYSSKNSPFTLLFLNRLSATEADVVETAGGEVVVAPCGAEEIRQVAP